MARFGHTRRDQLAHAVGSLESVGAPLLGAVFTMVPTRGGSAYSYSYSYGYYGNEKGARSSPRELAALNPPKIEDPDGVPPSPNADGVDTGAELPYPVGRRRRREGVD